MMKIGATSTFKKGDPVKMMADSGSNIHAASPSTFPHEKEDTSNTRPYYTVTGSEIEHYGTKNVKGEVKTADGKTLRSR